jgi:amidase
MEQLHFATAVELTAAIRNRRIGCEELLDLFLERVERINPALNAIIWMDADGARSRARAADAALANGEVWGPLHGLPMTIKESYNIAGAPTTWGQPGLAGNIADRNALSVGRLLAAGAVIFGKTNVPLNLADWQSYNAIYGSTNNPWNLKLTPGGSSGGSAAAVAAGLTGLEAGSDIGASIRNPAHYCGVFGHKPTYGIVPPRGQALPGNVAAADISVIGPMARGAADLDLALDVIAGPDLLDDAGWRLDLPPCPHADLKGFRVAVKLTDPNCDVDTAYADRLQGLADALAKAGAVVSDSAQPAVDTRRLHEVYILLLRAATSGRMTDEEVGQWRALQSEAEPGTYIERAARGNTLAHRDWLALNNERHTLRFAFAEFFREWDILLCPAAASAAWPHDQDGARHYRTISVNGREAPTTDQLFWAGYSGLVFLPSTVGPAGLVAPGLPVGYQAVAGHLRDKTAIGFSRLVAERIVGFEPPPGYD